MDAEEAKARQILARVAREHGLDVFGAGARLRRTSSRFCLSVEHGDYNGTELFGVGTDRFIWLAYKPNGTQTHRLFSANFPEDGVVTVPIGSVAAPPQSPQATAAQRHTTHWAHFALGADYILRTRGPYALTTGIDGVIYGNIPGGGMSRSASLTINLLLSILDANGLAEACPPMHLVDMSQAVETDYVGSPCGNLDQVMIVFAKAGCGTHYFPAERRVEHVPFGGSGAEAFRLLVLDTGTTRQGLQHSTYSVRRRECEELCRLAGLARLADVRDPALPKQLHARFGTTHPHLLARLDYIFEAQQRFAQMLAAWKAGDIAQVGALFRLDGIGLRDKYCISGPELEAMCDIVRCVPGVLGERMLGGGDKGASGCICTPEAVQWVRAAVATSYPRGHPLYATKWAVHECKFVQGISLLAPLSVDQA